MAFRGTFDYSLDAKNRLTVPSSFRPAFADGVVLAREVGPCVSVWTPDGYDGHVASALDGLHPLSPQGREMRRFLSAYAYPTELDGAGRVMVPPKLIDYAALGRDVTVNGADNHVELWPRGAWDDYDATLSQQFAKLTERFES